MLPLGMTMLVYYLINKRRWSSVKVIGLIIVLGIIGGVTGILTY
ncbi:MAG: PTS system mannose/fructose/sorbose family transporter subunit IID [Lachnospiraceae bacterium]|nr:PTS system mannose/fructose/sorbose family transporter subunit IID [Lachnospiraceae bacterium]